MAAYEDLTIEEWNELAAKLAEERLPMVNQLVKEPVPADGIYVRYGKRAVDIIISSLALTITLPLNIVFALCTFVDVGSPILFKQVRVGRNKRHFQLVKFRNMTNAKDERGNLLSASKRVTKFGKFMRKTSMDELLNFWSILKGDMSVIGPRPMPVDYEGRFNKRHDYRHVVRPGLECPPRKKLDHYWSWQEQFENDVWYVEHVSLRTDLYMFWRLVCYALDRKSSSDRSEGDERGSFIGYSLDGIVITESGVPDEILHKMLGQEGLQIDRGSSR